MAMVADASFSKFSKSRSFGCVFLGGNTLDHARISCGFVIRHSKSVPWKPNGGGLGTHNFRVSPPVMPGYQRNEVARAAPRKFRCMKQHDRSTRQIHHGHNLSGTRNLSHSKHSTSRPQNYQCITHASPESTAARTRSK